MYVRIYVCMGNHFNTSMLLFFVGSHICIEGYYSNTILLSKQAQHGPDRLKKPGAGSDGDRSARPYRRGAGRPLDRYSAKE